MEKAVVLVIDAISPYSQQLCKENLCGDTQLIFAKNDIELKKWLPQTDIIVTSTRGVSRKMMELAPYLRLIQKLGTGVNNIDWAAAGERGIYIGNDVGGNALSVAEYAVMLMLATLRHITIAHNRLVMENRWEKSTLRDNCGELTGKTVGIVGFGNIGRTTARLLEGFRCNILYYDPYPVGPNAMEGIQAERCNLDDICMRSDILSLHAPLTEQSRNMLDERRLKLMKDNAVLVNTGRGGLVDEAALCRELEKGRFLGVALDVHEHEPVLKDDPLKTFERVIFSPHTAAGTRECMERVIKSSFININSLLERGEIDQPKNIVNWHELLEVTSNG